MHDRFWILIPLGSLSAPAQAAPPPNAVRDHYADLAHAMYEDSLAATRSLRAAIDALDRVLQ